MRSNSFFELCADNARLPRGPRPRRPVVAAEPVAPPEPVVPLKPRRRPKPPKPIQRSAEPGAFHHECIGLGCDGCDGKGWT